MRTLRFLLEKEFRQIFRDVAILRVIFAMPIIQLMVLPFAADYEVKNINIAIVDNDHSTTARRLIDKMAGSGYFRVAHYTDSYREAQAAIESDAADLVLIVPPQFEHDIVRENEAKLMLSVNAVNGVKAGIGSAYAANIIREFSGDIRLEWLPELGTQRTPSVSSFETTYSLWFNPYMNYKIFMVPGILGFLVTMVGAFLCSLNIVREKEIGTIEQLNVTPISKVNFLLGKLIPFWILGNIVLAMGLFIAWALFGIIPEGSLLTLFGFAAVYLLGMLGFGLLISTVADTQQQAMLFSFFFLMVFVLLGGLYTNIDSMPMWAQRVAMFNPVSYFVEVSRMVILKGSRFSDILPQFYAICGFAVFFNILAVWNYRKRA